VSKLGRSGKLILIGTFFLIALVIISLRKPSAESITKKYNLVLDSGTVLVNGEILSKTQWTKDEKSSLKGVIERLSPISALTRSEVPLGACPVLTATSGINKITIVFYGDLTSMTTTNIIGIRWTRWFRCSDEDFLTMRALLSLQE
jgi:hypothetical protein